MKKIGFWAISAAISPPQRNHIHPHKFRVRILTENREQILTIGDAIPPPQRTIFIPINSELGS